MEAPEDEIGIAGTISDTTDNGASSYDGVNMHRTGSYDWDADGCGYFDNDAENVQQMVIPSIRLLTQFIMKVNQL